MSYDLKTKTPDPHCGSQKRLTCKRPPSPKCSTSRMLSDCMKAAERRKFPWGLGISKQCHASWWFEFSVYASGSLGVYQILTKLPIRQHKGLTRRWIIYSNFVITHWPCFQSWWRKAQGLRKQRLSGNILEAEMDMVKPISILIFEMRSFHKSF